MFLFQLEKGFFMNLDLFTSRNNVFSRDVTSDHNPLNTFRQELQERVNTILNRNQSRITMFSVDRIVEDYAVLENRTNGRMIDVPISKLPDNTREQVILRFENNTFSVDFEATEKARAEIRALRDRLRRQ